MKYSLEELARRYATGAHAATDQRRKYTNEPYIVHPAAVAELVRSVKHSEEMLAAAWLHDTVEDTATTVQDIERYFGPAVAELVVMLTSDSEAQASNRAARKTAYFRQTARATPEAQTIKLADIIDNTRSIVRYDPRFAGVYLVEKKIQVAALQRGDGELRKRAADIIEHGIAQLTAPPHCVPADWFSRQAEKYDKSGLA